MTTEERLTKLKKEINRVKASGSFMATTASVGILNELLDIVATALAGGDTDQHLAKVSADDYDFNWVDPGAGGGIESIGEGTGITVDDSDPANPVVGFDGVANEVLTNVSGFGGNLSSADDTVQKALDTLDDLEVGGGSGDMTKAEYDTDDDGIVDKAETVDDGEGNSKSASDIKNHIDSTSNPHSVTKTQVGLGNVSDDAQLKIASNLSDVNNKTTSQNNLLPDQTGNNGKVLGTNGTNVGWVEQSEGGGIESVQGGNKISIDDADPLNPIVNYDGVEVSKVRVASTGNLSMIAGWTVIDGVTLVNLDRVLVRRQTNDEENGIYVHHGDGSHPRADDFDNWDDELVGSVVFVEEGDLNGNTTWFCNIEPGGTLDSDPIDFVAIGSTLSTVGDGADLIKEKVNNEYKLRSIEAGNDYVQIDYSLDGNKIKISMNAFAITTALMFGLGIGLIELGLAVFDFGTSGIILG